MPLPVVPVQLNTVLPAAVEEVNDTIADAVLEQIVWFNGLLVIVALGFTVIVTVNGAPAHVPSLGVTL
jgi:choline-glycine betaine transporter